METTYFNLGHIFELNGQYKDSAKYFSFSAKYSKELGNQSGYLHASAYQAKALSDSGDNEKAYLIYQEISDAIKGKRDDKYLYDLFLLDYTYVLYKLNNFKEAEAYVQEMKNRNFDQYLEPRSEAKYFEILSLFYSRYDKDRALENLLLSKEKMLEYWKMVVKKRIYNIEVQSELSTERQRRSFLLKEVKTQSLIKSLMILATLLTILSSYLLFRVRKKNHLIQILGEKEKTFEERKAKDHAYQEFRKIIYPHQLEQIKKGRLIEKTMPSESQKAVCICFDIQNSSEIGHSEHPMFFSAILKSCYDVMMEDYDGDLLKSNAYMIKELGDGFLCSVGFPFKCYSDSIADEAIRLAYQFVEVFKEVSHQFLPDKEIYCSLGLAYGDVRGFFPKAGLKYYDVFGDAVLKATRYESLRKTIFKNNEQKTSIITLDLNVYSLLSESWQSSFTEFRLGDHKIRGDKDATRAYYQKIWNTPKNIDMLSS